ncbi:MAG: hypothetical protein KDB14_07575 [Planctomycetales bacterium]|nr:hypothetical protein [Planctomycetales bacterium]
MGIRLILDSRLPGVVNMGRDEALLETVGATGVPVLRLYGWSVPTLSLGYFQSAADRPLHPPSADCDWVRRSTGGGAILHDEEITYSFCWPAPPRGDLHVGYRWFHESLVRTLESLGIVARRCPADQTQSPPPFLCFQRRAQGDLLIDNAKVGGSAQRRRHGAALQHGSVLWRRSPCAPELPGIADLTDCPLTLDAFRESWIAELECSVESLVSSLGLPVAPRLAPSDWTEDEQARATQSIETRFATAAWNEKR